MLLETGFYTIRTLPTEHLIGRNLVEEHSIKPKGIFGQPRGVPASPQSTFYLQRIVGDGYFITCGPDHGQVMERGGKVVAGVSEYAYGQPWVIRRQPQHGMDVFTIESADGYWGWVMPSSEPFYTPVVVRSLVASAGFYVPNALWIVESI